MIETNILDIVIFYYFYCFFFRFCFALLLGSTNNQTEFIFFPSIFNWVYLFLFRTGFNRFCLLNNSLTEGEMSRNKKKKKTLEMRNLWNIEMPKTNRPKFKWGHLCHPSSNIEHFKSQSPKSTENKKIIIYWLIAHILYNIFIGKLMNIIFCMRWILFMFEIRSFELVEFIKRDLQYPPFDTKRNSTNLSKLFFLSLFFPCIHFAKSLVNWIVEYICSIPFGFYTLNLLLWVSTSNW